MLYLSLSHFSQPATRADAADARSPRGGHTHPASRWRGGALAAWAAALLLLLALVSPQRAKAETPNSIDMKLLLISANGTEPTLGGMRAVLDQIGVPYDVLIATRTTFNARTLSDGAGAGRYQGILLATGNLGYEAANGDFVSAFSAEQWQALWDYERDFRVRQATLYTYPAGLPDNYGLNLNSAVDTTSTPVKATLTAAGKGIFSYMSGAAPLTISNAWTYLATPASSSNPVPLLQTPEGYAIASVYTYADGRNNLTITADGNENLIHTLALGYGIVNWVSKGVFMGARKVYMNPQPDDVLIEDDMWDPVRRSPDGAPFRMSGNDLTRLADWQNQVRIKRPTASRLLIEMPYNGVGATGIYANDTLTPAVKSLQGQFRWISHTYTHANLDAIKYTPAYNELRKNDNMATTLNFDNYSYRAMIQPDISGLNNPAFLRAAVDFGIRWILSDTSQPGWNNPTPNTGFYSSYQPSILIIPRRPTNLYYNVSTPAEWVSEYNWFYAPGGQFAYWDHALSFPEILDKESDMMLLYMLRYDVDSLMFHQPNLRAYDGTRSLMGDLIDATLAKYEQLFNLPVLSPGQVATGQVMAARMAYNKSGAKATLNLGPSPTITLRVTNAATVPLTGVTMATGTETYGGQKVSRITLPAGGTATVPGPAW